MIKEKEKKKKKDIGIFGVILVVLSFFSMLLLAGMLAIESIINFINAKENKLMWLGMGILFILFIFIEIILIAIFVENEKRK